MEEMNSNRCLLQRMVMRNLINFEQIFVSQGLYCLRVCPMFGGRRV